eukprot:1794866-Rhodomonas_salina.1
MSCHGAIITPDWDRALSFWGLNEKTRTKIKRACMHSCVLGNHKIANARRARLEMIRAQASGAPGGRSGRQPAQ